MSLRNVWLYKWKFLYFIYQGQNKERYTNSAIRQIPKSLLYFHDA